MKPFTEYNNSQWFEPISVFGSADCPNNYIINIIIIIFFIIIIIIHFP